MKLSYESISEDCSVVLNTNTLMALLPIFPASASFIINHYKSHLEREYPFDIISGLYPNKTKIPLQVFRLSEHTFVKYVDKLRGEADSLGLIK